MSRARASWLVLLAVASAVALSFAAGSSGAPGDVGWRGWGNTPDNMRLSPLTQITKGNIDQVGRVFTFNFRSVDPNARLGNQTYPVVLGNRMYVTTGESQTWALDATTGKVIWRWTPNNVAVFNKAGIVANRGVAVCDGHVFVLTIDMTIAMLNQNTGELIKRVPISSAVPGAATRYGYSETSAPICARHRVITGAAGSEYGVRGFVMAFKSSDLSPAWANPVWSIPPSGTGWRRISRIVGGGVTWTPVTVDITSNTVYYGTGSATPLYFPAWRPGSAPRTDSLIAVNLLNGKLKWWQQQMAHNEWSYDTAQPPLVYNAKVGGKSRRVVSVATMEGVWFCYDAATGKPIYQRVKVIDRTEHPPLQPGKPVVVYPGSIGGLNFSPAAYDPKTNYIFNAAAETAGILIQRKLTPTQKKRKRLQGDIFLGLVNGDFGSYLPGWHDHGSISAINVNTGKRVWKFQTPEPERGGVSITASGIGFAGGGDGNLRAFDLSNGNVLWKFQTGRQIAAGPAIYSVDGKQYVAIAVGGTPTSSNGGVVPGVQVFAIGGSHDQSPPPSNLPPFRSLQSRNAQAEAGKTLVFTPSKSAAPQTVVGHKRPSTVTAGGRARIVTGRPLVVRPWNPNSSNWQFAFGKLFLGSRPVAHAQLRVDRFTLPALTGAQGGFTYPADITEPGRHEVRVVGLSRATVNGRKLTSAEKAAVSAAHGAFNVGYRFSNLHAKVQSNGTVRVTGHVANSSGSPPPAVGLYTYSLDGTITDAAGKPVQGAVVVGRTNDRDFWTFSGPSDANGHYTSYFHASDESDEDPVTINIGVALGSTSYGGNLGTAVKFKRNQSATMNIQLGSGTRYTISPPDSYVGAIYEGPVVGVAAAGKVVKPSAARWPDSKGNFVMVLPASVRGKTISFWQSRRLVLSRFATTAGGGIDLRSWPARLGTGTPSRLATLGVPRS
jgi:PQQ-dependent dehydrogenase (methanol/ethanol family)